MIGIIVNNIGSPEQAQPEAVGQYLREFLMDKNIIGAPFLVRWFLVHGIIVPRRKYLSAEKYQKIWTEAGSPLTALTQSFANKLQTAMTHQEFKVVVGNRYGKPSLEQAVLELEQAGAKKIYLLPMYPQWAQATTGSAIEKFKEVLTKHNISKEISILRPFYSDPRFIHLQAQNLQRKMSEFKSDFVLFSYHGLPVSQVKKISGCYQQKECCSLPQACEKNCYRAQCLKTSELIAKASNLAPGSWESGFQSRLGPTKWIEPSTSDKIKELAKKGIKKILIQTPSFTVDCLETLEEIAIELRKEFISLGGEDLQMVSCLNDQQEWIKAFPEILNRNLR